MLTNTHTHTHIYIGFIIKNDKWSDLEPDGPVARAHTHLTQFHGDLISSASLPVHAEAELGSLAHLYTHTHLLSAVLRSWAPRLFVRDPSALIMTQRWSSFPVVLGECDLKHTHTHAHTRTRTRTHARARISSLMCQSMKSWLPVFLPRVSSVSLWGLFHY